MAFTKRKYLRPAKRVRALIVFTVLGLTGCSGTLYTVDDNDTTRKGVFVYPPALLIQVFTNTAFIKKDGTLVATVNGAPTGKKCQPQDVYKIVSGPDYSRPHRVYYEPGFLENNKFGLQLKEGVLTSVNTESQPDRGETLKNLASAAQSFAAVAAIRPEEQLACNATPRFKAIYKAPKTQDFPG